MKQETVVRSEQENGEHNSGKWMGVLLVFMGAIFFLGSSGVTIAGYSPSMLIALVPIFLIFMAAYRHYREDGRLTRRVVSIAIFSVLPIAYLAAMALGYSVSGMWPLGAIVAGISFLLYSSRK